MIACVRCDGGGGGIARRERRIELRLRACCRPATSVFCRASVTSALRNCARPVVEIRLLDRIVEIDQQGARLHVLPGFEMDGGDDAGDLRGDVDALIGAQRADRGELRRPLLGVAGCAQTEVGFGAKAAEMKPLTMFGLMTNWK